LADRWGEADPRKIASLPADILQHWQAWFAMQREEPAEEAPEETTQEPNIAPTAPAVDPDIGKQCADVMRMLGR